VLPQPLAVRYLVGRGLVERGVVGEDAVLLDDDPAVVGALAQLGDERVEVDVPFPERAEQAAPPGRQRVGALGFHAVEDL
jgi:hypothetical protein